MNTSARRLVFETLMIFGVGTLLVVVRPLAYDVRVFTLVAIYALAGTGLNILTGFTGMFSAGHSGFLLVGAYAWALLSTKASAVVAMMVGLVIGVAVAWALGWLCLRLRTHFLAVATIAFGMIVWITARNWESLTGGNNGITGVARIRLPGVPSSISVYLLVLALLAVFFYFQEGLRLSRLGMSMLASRGDEDAARSLGISVQQMRVLGFTISAIPAVLAGVFLAQLTTYVSPDQFEIPMAVSLVAVPIIGGRGWRWAPLVGALVVGALPEYVRFLADYRLVLYGAVVTAIALFFPDGLRQLAEEGRRGWARRWSRGTAER